MAQFTIPVSDDDLRLVDDVYDNSHSALENADQLAFSSADYVEGSLGVRDDYIQAFWKDLSDILGPQPLLDGARRLTDAYREASRTDAYQFQLALPLEIDHIRQIFLAYPVILEQLQPHQDFGIPARETLAKLRDDLETSTNEVNLCQQKLSDVTEINTQLQGRFAALQDERDTLNELANKLSELPCQLQAAKNENSRLEQSIKALFNENINLRAKVQEAEETKKRLMTDIETFEQRNQNLQDALQKGNADYARLERQTNPKEAADLQYDEAQETFQPRLGELKTANAALLRERDELIALEQKRRSSFDQLSRENAELSAALTREQENLLHEKEKSNSRERTRDAYRRWCSVWLTQTEASDLGQVEQDLEEAIDLAERLNIRDAVARKPSTVLSLHTTSVVALDLREQVHAILVDLNLVNRPRILDIHKSLEYADIHRRKLTISMLYVSLKKKSIEYARGHTIDACLCLLTGIEVIGLWLHREDQFKLLNDLQGIAPFITNSDDILLQAIAVTIQECFSGNPMMSLYESLRNIPHPRLESQGFVYVQYDVNLLVLTPDLQIVHSLLANFSIETRVLCGAEGNLSVRLVFKNDPVLQNFESGWWMHDSILDDVIVLKSALKKRRDSII